MGKILLLSELFLLLILLTVSPGSSSEGPDKTPVLTFVQRMESAFRALENYTCEVEQTYYKDGVEDRRYLFKSYFMKEKNIRIDFFQPFPSLTIFYRNGEQEATVTPFRSLPALQFRFSMDNPMIKTPTGQKINQTDMGHFIQFVFKNLQRVDQGKEEYDEGRDQVRFLFWALDYIDEKYPEKYWIILSQKSWFPIRIERYSLQGKPIEVSEIKNYTINTRLPKNFFLP